MPNHASNALYVTGPDAPAFMAAVADGTDDNFVNTLVPMPAELQGISTGSCQIDGEQVTEWRTDADGKNVKISDVDRQHAIDLHGTIDWYDWCRKHWGTKWGAYDATIDYDAKSIHFNSAWSPPVAAIKTISTMFPDAVFTIAYAEGGSGYWGVSVWENGDLIGEEESSEFWDENAPEDADAMDSLTPECAAHLDEYGLHTGG